MSLSLTVTVTGTSRATEKPCALALYVPACMTTSGSSVEEPVAWATQSAAALRTASLVCVAPPTASTSAVWASRIACSSWVAAVPPMVLVSEAASMLASVIAAVSNVMVTVTSPPKPG